MLSTIHSGYNNLNSSILNFKDATCLRKLWELDKHKCEESTLWAGKERESRWVMSNSLWPPWTLAHQAPLSMEIFQARILEQVAIPFSKGSYQPRDWIQVKGCCVNISLFFLLSQLFFLLLELAAISPRQLTLSISSPLLIQWLEISRGGNSCTMGAYVVCRFSHVQLFATLWMIAQQASLSMGFSRQGYWSGLPCPRPEHLPNPGIEPESLKSVCTGRWVLYH